MHNVYILWATRWWVALKLLRQGDMVWIHNYPLLLVPQKLRAAAPPNVVISLFLHTPFPSPEVWRNLPVISP